MEFPNLRDIWLISLYENDEKKGRESVRGYIQQNDEKNIKVVAYSNNLFINKQRIDLGFIRAGEWTIIAEQIYPIKGGLITVERGRFKLEIHFLKTWVPVHQSPAQE